jgi:mannan endo-1,4-beta-mannosidase
MKQLYRGTIEKMLRNIPLILFLFISSPAWAATYSLIDPHATAATVAMYNRITGYMDLGKTALGQHVYNNDKTLKSKDWYTVTGTYPMFMEWDWGDFHRGRNNTSLSTMPPAFTAAMQSHYNAGGIIGIFWQMNNWSSDCGGNCSAYDLAGNTAARILPGGADRANYLAQLKNFANWCKGPMANYPMLFRTYHENDGKFFWWGSSATTDANYVSLYQDMVAQLEGFGVHNLIYVYSPQLINGYSTYTGARYPGNNYVDIFGIDRYYGQNDNEYIFNDISAYDTAEVAAAANNKPYAIVEGYNDQNPADGAYSNTFWTIYMGNIQTDPLAKQAVYIAFWTSESDPLYNSVVASYGPVINRGDSQNFNEMLKDYPDLLTLSNKKPFSR